MQKKLTITVDEEVHAGIHKGIAPRKISKFAEELVHPHVVRPNLESAYNQMAKGGKKKRWHGQWQLLRT